MRLACKHPLDDRELWEAECSVNILTDAVGLRISTLESRSYLSSNSILLIRVRATGHFVTHNLDPSKEFELAYNGMVSYMRRGFIAVVLTSANLSLRWSTCAYTGAKVSLSIFANPSE
jgi:hypothetical protein